MINFLKKYRKKLINFCFPRLEHFYLVLSVVLILFAWLLPESYWRLRVVLFWLLIITNEIDSEGLMERDYLPVQPGSSIFYHIYRFLDTILLLFLFVLLVILLLPGLIRIKEWFLGIFLGDVILRAAGDHKYRPKKPEE